MQEFVFWTNTQSFAEDADQSALLNRATDVRSLSFKAMGVFLVLVSAVLLWVTVPMLLAGNWDLGLLFMLLLATVLGMLAWVLTGWSVRTEVKAGRKERQKAGIRDRQVTVRLSDEGCFVTIEPEQLTNRVFDWNDIGKIAESEDLFFLAGKKVPGICLRKGALQSGTEDELRDFLQSKYDKTIKKYEIKTDKLQRLLKE